VPLRSNDSREQPLGDDTRIGAQTGLFRPGDLLCNRFRVVRLIARGGMGELYEAEDLVLGEPIALKTIRTEIAADERARQRFRREVQLARKVTHPNICRTFDLFEHGFDSRMAIWLAAVLVGTGIAGLRGRLPGVEPRPYIIRFTEDRPNPLYRRICYTFAWSEVVTFAVLNIVGAIGAIASGHWYLKQIYQSAYFPIAGTIWLLGALGQLPRVKRSTKGEGHERRYFYGSVWAVCFAQPVLWLLWKVLPRTTEYDVLKLVVFVGILAFVGNLARLGRLPRTRPIVPGELAVSD